MKPEMTEKLNSLYGAACKVSAEIASHIEKTYLPSRAGFWTRLTRRKGGIGEQKQQFAQDFLAAMKTASQDKNATQLQKIQGLLFTYNKLKQDLEEVNTKYGKALDNGNLYKGVINGYANKIAGLASSFHTIVGDYREELNAKLQYIKANIAAEKAEKIIYRELPNMETLKSGTFTNTFNSVCVTSKKSHVEKIDPGYIDTCKSAIKNDEDFLSRESIVLQQELIALDWYENQFEIEKSVRKEAAEQGKKLSSAELKGACVQRLITRHQLREIADDVFWSEKEFLLEKRIEAEKGMITSAKVDHLAIEEYQGWLNGCYKDDAVRVLPGSNEIFMKADLASHDGSQESVDLFKTACADVITDGRKEAEEDRVSKMVGLTPEESKKKVGTRQGRAELTWVDSLEKKIEEQPSTEPPKELVAYANNLVGSESEKAVTLQLS